MTFKTPGLTRRSLLAAGSAAVSAGVLPASADDDETQLVRQLTGKTPALSDRVHLVMPRTFPNGDTVPLALAVDSPMTDIDHVRRVHVLAPKNPIVEVVSFHFTPARSEARVSTRIRLAEPQYVLAVAEMNDGALLMAKTWVDVATNGCT